MNYKLLHIFFFLFFFVSTNYAQFCGKQSYSIKDGLNQPYQYSMMDSKGKLWVDSRGGGINMFDGKKWTNFTLSDGLLYTWGTPIFEDKEGGIWITHNYEKGVSRYINNTFTNYVMPNSNIDSLTTGQYPFPFVQVTPYFKYNEIKDELLVFHLDSTSQVWMHTFNFKTKQFDATGIPFFSEEVDYTQKLTERKFWYYLINDLKGNYHILYFNKNGDLKSIDQQGNVTLLLNSKFTHPSGIINCIFQEKDGSFSASYEKNGDLYLKKNNEHLQIPAPSLQNYGLKNGELDLSFEKFAIFHYFVSQESHENIIALWKVNNPEFENSYVLTEYNTQSWEIENTLLFSEDKTVGRIAKDKAGTYWYCNGSSEVRLFPNQHWIATGFQGMPAEAWAVGQTGDHKIWFGSYRKELVSYDGAIIEKTKDEILQEQIFMDGSVGDEDGNLYFTTLNGILKFNESEQSSFLAEKKYGFFLNKNRNGELMFGTQKEGLWILPKNKEGKLQSDWNRIDHRKGLGLLNIITAIEDHQGRYWMGRGSQGLAIYFPKQDTTYNWIKESDPTHFGVQSMDEDTNGNIWLGTDNGLRFFDQQKHEITPDFDFQQNSEIVGTDYLENTIVQVCKIYKDSILVVGNGLGYYLINLNKWYATPRQLDIQSFTEEDGHQAGAIVQNGIWIDHRDDIWLTCSNGVIRYTPSDQSDYSEVPEVIIDEVFVGDTKVEDLTKSLAMGASQRNITIKFHAATNTNVLGKIAYRYRLNKTEDWSPLINTDYINFYNLSPGKYNFEVLSERNGYQSIPAHFQFEIDKSIAEKPWFYLAACLLIFGFGVNYSLGEKKLRNRQNAINTITKEKEALQIQTIVNQLNPHFINNALQWLQIRLDKNKDIEAVSVVGKLSENISTVFKNSRTKKAFHSLENELKLTENYLYIQKIRFKENLKYELPSISEFQHLNNINIPLLMLQIHVENAVEHGIRNKAAGGKVKVTLNEDNQFVYLNIVDDGVGRKVAKRIGSHGTQNGLAMLEEITSIYNKQNTLKLTQEFIDNIHTNEHGTPYGTKVIIKIPKNYNSKI